MLGTFDVSRFSACMKHMYSRIELWVTEADLAGVMSWFILSACAMLQQQQALSVA